MFASAASCHANAKQVKINYACYYTGGRGSRRAVISAHRLSRSFALPEHRHSNENILPIAGNHVKPDLHRIPRKKLRMTRVTHLSYRTSSGGAARSASRIHQTMLQRGVNSVLLAVENESGGEQVYATKPSMRPLKRIYRHGLRTFYGRRDRIEQKPDAPCGVFTSDRSFRGSELIGDLRDPDIIHMHWVAEMFDESEFLPAATRMAPVVWTMRDMRPITGGCHYDLGCGKFRDGCGNCPQLANPRPRDISYRIWKRRMRTLAHIEPSRLTFVSPSHWLMSEFQASPLCNRFRVHMIPNGVDTGVFHPRDDSSWQPVAGVDPQAFVILFNAASLHNRIKGSGLLLAALKQVAQELPAKPKIQLLIVGSGRFDEDHGIPSTSLGQLHGNEELAAAYQSADLFVIPSLQDNCPNTVLEAFACGVPVVGFDSSGIADLVIPGETGLLAKSYEERDLAEKVLTIAHDHFLREKMAHRCRQVAVENYSRQIEAKRYLDLYQQILDVKS